MPIHCEGELKPFSRTTRTPLDSTPLFSSQISADADDSPQGVARKWLLASLAPLAVRGRPCRFRLVRRQFHTVVRCSRAPGSVQYAAVTILFSSSLVDEPSGGPIWLRPPSALSTQNDVFVYTSHRFTSLTPLHDLGQFDGGHSVVRLHHVGISGRMWHPIANIVCATLSRATPSQHQFAASFLVFASCPLMPFRHFCQLYADDGVRLS